MDFSDNVTSKIVQFQIEHGRVTVLYANGSLWRGALSFRTEETLDWRRIKGPLDEIELEDDQLQA